MRLRSVLLAGLVACLALAYFAAPGSAGPQRIYGVENCTTPTVKPKRIVFACGDFGLYANHFDWKHWGDRRAKSDGVLHVKVCDPSCAAGYFKDYPVKVVLHKIRTWSCAGVHGRYYRKIKLRYPGEKPDSANRIPKEFFCV